MFTTLIISRLTVTTRRNSPSGHLELLMASVAQRLASRIILERWHDWRGRASVHQNQLLASLANGCRVERRNDDFRHPPRTASKPCPLARPGVTAVPHTRPGRPNEKPWATVSNAGQVHDHTVGIRILAIQKQEALSSCKNRPSMPVTDPLHSFPNAGPHPPP